jgi:hypothetical protein
MDGPLWCSPLILKSKEHLKSTHGEIVREIMPTSGEGRTLENDRHWIQRTWLPMKICLKDIETFVSSTQMSNEKLTSLFVKEILARTSRLRLRESFWVQETNHNKDSIKTFRRNNTWSRKKVFPLKGSFFVSKINKVSMDFGATELLNYFSKKPRQERWLY